MSNGLSKTRARRIRSREKQAGRAAAQRRPWAQRPGKALLIGVALWLLTMLTLHAEHVFGAPVAGAAWLGIAGRGVMLLAGLFSVALVAEIVAPHRFHNIVHLAVMGLIATLAVLLARGVLYGATTALTIREAIFPFLMPVAMAPLMTTILLGGPVGAIVGLWTSFVFALMLDQSFMLLTNGLLASAVAAHIANGVRTRARVIRAGLVVGLSQVLVVLAFTAINWRTTDLVLVIDQAGACLLMGFLSALIVLLVMPAFETGFGITTNLTLLELTDLSHPLLQRMAIEAPGTYHHSLIVANLAQAAADEIGANSLLARVCAYFHDIGKLTKPEFFSENIQRDINPHDSLPPSMSTLVITSHVKEGLGLAMLHKLPEPVKAVIREHHGTSVVAFFHHKAQTLKSGETGNDRTRVDDGDFRYPGPRPLSRESGIICLADGVEAASRSLDKYTPTQIEQTVAMIFQRKLTDGQLDNCELSLVELSRIQRAFVFTLTNMLHGRIPYPKDEDNDRQPAETGSTQPDRAAGSGRLSDGATGATTVPANAPA